MTANKKYTTFTSEAEYKAARKIYDEYEEDSKAYRQNKKTNGIPKEIHDAFRNAPLITNELRSAIEEYEFRTEKPATYFLYIDEKNFLATTWTGQKLGDATFGRDFSSNFGDNRRHITVRATNGAVYYGTFFKSAGDYARVKLSNKKS